jgi:uncharacterized protein YaaQ
VKLVLVVVNPEDADTLVRLLLQADFRVTKIKTVGGFLREGNLTLLIGAEDDQVPRILELVEQNCRRRVRQVQPLPPPVEGIDVFIPMPVEVEVGGATVFVLPVEGVYRF